MHRFKTISLRSLVLVPAFLALTGAKGEGCGGESVDPQPPPEPIVCPAGSHAINTCDDVGIMDGVVHGPGVAENCVAPPDECEMICVPDACAPGFHEETVCVEPAIACAEGEDCDLPPPTCQVECVPSCPAGEVPEIICSAEPEPVDPQPEPLPGEPASDEGPMGVCELVCMPAEPGEPVEPVEPLPAPEPAPSPEPGM